MNDPDSSSTTRVWWWTMLGLVAASCGGSATVEDPFATASPSTAPTRTGVELVTMAAPLSSPTSVTQVPEDPALLPWVLVDSAPGVRTPGLVYELMPRLWAYLPTTEDLAAGITWVWNAEDAPVIEAYLHAQLTYFEAVTSRPVDLSSGGWNEWFTDGGADIAENLADHVASGDVVDLAEGVVLRPQVLGEGRTATTAAVWDCLLDGSVFVTPDGELAQGSQRGTIATGREFLLQLTSKGWQVARLAHLDAACA